MTSCWQNGPVLVTDGLAAVGRTVGLAAEEPPDPHAATPATAARAAAASASRAGAPAHSSLVATVRRCGPRVVPDDCAMVSTGNRRAAGRTGWTRRVR